MKNTTSLTILTLVMSVFGGMAADNDELGHEPANISVEEWVRIAASNNPELRSSRQDSYGYRYRVRPMGTLPNPLIGYRQYTQSEMRKRSIEVMQDIPFPGTLRYQRGAARQQAESAFFRTQQEELNLAYEVRSSYARLALYHAKIARLKEEYKILAQMEESLSAGIGGGQQRGSALLMAQMERVRVGDRLATTKTEKKALEYQARYLLGIENGETLPSTPNLEDLKRSAGDTIFEASLDKLPIIREAQSQLEARRQEVSAVGAANRPNMWIGAEWMEETGEDEISVFAGISLPIFRGAVRDENREALARQRAASYRLESVRQQRSQDIQQTLELLKNADRRIHLYRDQLLPLAESTIETENSAFQNGETGLIDLLTAQRTLLQTQDAYDEALVEAYLLSALYRKQTTQP